MMSKKYLPIAFTFILFNLPLASTAVWGATSSKCPGEQGYIYTNDRNSRNPRAGGFVSNSALVGDYVFIAPTAAVCGSASVLEYARVYGSAVVSDEAEVTNKARVYGNARVFGTAFVGGTAKVSDHAQVSGDAVVEGKAWVRGYTKISSGNYAEGTKKSVKPQSVIDAEKRQAAATAAKRAKEKAAQDQAALKREAEASLKQIGRELSYGGYSVNNYNRQVTYTYDWSHSSTDNSGRCGSVRMRESRRQTGLRSGNKIGNDSRDYYTINASYSGLEYRNDSDYDPEYCLAYSNEYRFCFSTYDKVNQIIGMFNNHRAKYCR